MSDNLNSSRPLCSTFYQTFLSSTPERALHCVTCKRKDEDIEMENFAKSLYLQKLHKLILNISDFFSDQFLPYFYFPV